MNLSELLKNTCKDMNITVSELARRTEQTPSNLTMRIRRKSVDFEEFLRYMEVMGVNVNFDLTYPDGMKPEMKVIDRHAKDRIVALEASLEAERRAAEFEKNLNVDTRTALYNICGCLAKSLKNADDPRALFENLERAKVSADGLARLYDNVVFPGMESPEIEIDTEIRDVAEILKGKRVLIAEDNELNLGITSDVLEEKGLLVDCVMNGAEAVKRIKHAEPGTYCCVLMDIQMPVIDGVEATTLIRALPNRVRAGVPIVAMTSNAYPEDRRNAKKAGMDGYLVKPVDTAKLLQTIADLI